jgi:hypothetical protein
MIDALESFNLTQRSQSNTKEMSWDERGCFGSVQCAHKNVKSLRERARSQPRGIYSRTPQIAVGLKFCTTDAFVARPRHLMHARVPRVLNVWNPTVSRPIRQMRTSWFSLASVGPTDATQRAQNHILPRQTRLVNARQMRPSVCRSRVCLTTKPWATDADVARLSLRHPCVWRYGQTLAKPGQADRCIHSVCRSQS